MDRENLTFFPGWHFLRCIHARVKKKNYKNPWADEKRARKKADKTTDRWPAGFAQLPSFIPHHCSCTYYMLHWERERKRDLLLLLWVETVTLACGPFPVTQKNQNFYNWISSFSELDAAFGITYYEPEESLEKYKHVIGSLLISHFFN